MDNLDFSNWKCRASALGNIMHLDSNCKVTPKQIEIIADYQGRESLTENQAKELKRLIDKRDAPPSLSKGAKTYLKDVFFGQVFDFEKRFTNKFTEKGNEMESPAIAKIIDYLGLPMVVKNEQHYSSDYTKGTPDAVLKALNFQFDVKNVFYPKGLNSFEGEAIHNYTWQIHAYNNMVGVEHGFVIKILLNPSEETIYREARVFWVDGGGDWKEPIPNDFINDVRDYYDFEAKKPIEDRIKMFHVETKQEHKDLIKQAVELSRIELNRLAEEWKSKNQNEIQIIRSLYKNRGKLSA